MSQFAYVEISEALWTSANIRDGLDEYLPE
jgi:hypothetical protein